MERMFFQSVVSLRCSSESLVECVLEQRQIQTSFPRERVRLSLFSPSSFSLFFLFSIIIVLSGSSKLSFNSPKNFHPTLEKSHFNEGEVSIDALNFRERIFDIIRTNEKYIRANRKKMYIRSFNCGL